MYNYVGYGLNILSEIELPELENATHRSSPTVGFRLGHVDLDVPDGRESFVRLGTDAVTLYYRGAGSFHVQGGTDVIMDLEEGAPPSYVRTCLLGPVIAGLLNQRRLLVLHASAVAVDDGSVAFLGGQGWGKSTTAAFMGVSGHELLADDVTAVEVGQSTVFVRRGFGHLKLWPESVRGLGLDPDSLPLIRPGRSKRGLKVRCNVERSRLALRAVFVLGMGDEVRVERLRRTQAMLDLVAHSYLAQHLKETGVHRLHFEQCSQLVGRVPVYSLQRPASFDALGETRSAVLEAVSHSRSPARAAGAVPARNDRGSLHVA